jgi:hypothetical protein
MRHHGTHARAQAAVSLAWLKDLVRQHKLAESNMTTFELVMKLVKPATAARRCRYSELLLGDPAQACHVSQGRPFYFVSHAWCRPFAETLGMVARHFEPEQQRLWKQQQQQEAAGEGPPPPPALLQDSEVYLWFDMFAIVSKGLGAVPHGNPYLPPSCTPVVVLGANALPGREGWM